MELSPLISAEIAEQIYYVQDTFDLRVLLARKEFSSNSNNKVVVKAEVGTRLIHIKDNFGLCARGAGNYKNDIFFVFRGTTGVKADWATDARIGVQFSATGSLVHSGFNQTFNSMTNELSQFLSQHTDAINVHCIGHSLGGAVATLTADWIKENYSKNVKLYTFGCPRVGFGFTGFANKITNKIGKENIHRVYHGSDPVTMIPVFPFIHAPQPGEGYYFSFNGRTMSFKAHFMKNYVQSVIGTEWAAMGKFATGIPSHITLKQWLTSTEVVNANDVGAWEKINYIFRYLFQSLLATIQPVGVGVLTAADQLAMMLHRGIKISTEAADWVFYLIRRMMQMMGMKVVESVEQLSEALIRMVLQRIVAYIGREVKKAMDNLLG